MENKFAHLHVHTEYSLLDGATRLNRLFQRADELGIGAVAITDHGNMFGVLEFVKTAIRYTDPKADPFEFIAQGREPKVKPIIGCEVYMADDMHEKSSSGGRMPKFNHLVLLAKNETGYKNLIKIVSEAYTEGLYYKPRTDFAHIEGRTEGLICLSACLAGAIPQALLKNDYETADRLVEKFKSLFGEDFYIEIQNHNLKDQKYVLPGLRALALKHGVKMVATNDVHYLNKEDAVMQKVLQCISFRKTMSIDEGFDDEGDGVNDDGYFPTREFYLKSPQEMQELFADYEGAITTTAEIADKCDFRFFRKEKLLPGYFPEDGSEPYEFLRKLCYDGLKRKYGEITATIEERAEYELGIIHRLGFVDYFLIVWDFINYSETHGVPVGPGRGSGVGSIVAYAIGITKVDPLKYSLIFERFLNAERVSNPDFDIDFCVDGRERVIQYVIDKYGEKNVSQIITFGTLAAKNAIKDVGRVFNHPYSEVDRITKLMPKMMGKNHIGHVLGLLPTKDGSNAVIPELKELYETDDMSKRILDMAMKIEGMPRQTGMHAAGVIICRDEIADHIPMAMSGDGIVTTQFNMIECEELGLLKMDFLGLRTLTDINKAIIYTQKTKGIKLDFYNMGYDDPEVFKLISDGDTHAVFQLESEGMKKFMRDLKPSSLEDIIAGISLYRPGPMDKIGDYVYNKKNPDKVTYDHDLLEPILKVTYGIMVYQEQVMEIVRKLGGYSFGRADIVRRMMSKKKKEAMEKEREIFLNGTVDHGVEIKGCIANGVSAQIANKIYDDMISFASYAFNKSHAAAYGYLAYQTAYLKRYHTVQFITAVLNNRITSIEEITNYLTYLKERNIPVYPPNVNKSFVEFEVEGEGVRIGFAAIKNVGTGVVKEIVAEREANGEFTDFVSFVERMQARLHEAKQKGENGSLNKKMLESLIYAGTFDCFGKTRSQLVSVYEKVLERGYKDLNAKVSGQFSMFDLMGDKKDDFEYPNIKEYPQSEKLRLEKEYAGVYLTGHPLEEHSATLRAYEFNTSMLKFDEDSEDGIEDGKSVTLGGMLVEAGKKVSKSGRELGIGKLEDLYGTVDLMLAPFKISQYKAIFKKDALVTVTGKVRINNDSVSVWVDSLTPWGTQEKPPVNRMCVYLNFSQISEKTIDEIYDIIRSYPGQDEFYIKNLDDGVLNKLNTTVSASTMLKNELFGIEEIKDIKIVKS
ncbi:MAG: DNA polymerase III subunit alpha [Clostridia bacterium]|nr:DNA polymerase III subunit alpha [Clostridia bacterium]